MIRATPVWRLAAVGAALTVPAVLLAAGVASPPPAEEGDHVDLYQDGIAVLADGSVLALPAGAGAAYLPGSRVLDPTALDPALLAATPSTGTSERPAGHVLPDGADRLGVVVGPGAVPVLPGGAAPSGTLARLGDPDLADDAAAASRAWLAEGTVPGAHGPFEELGTGALLDLHAMTLAGGASVAGPSPYWRYVWPRDASFTVAAYARTGHLAEAEEVLAFLAGVQEPDGSFQARYLPDASGVPDERGPQSDGNGWVLWAAGVLLDEAATLGGSSERDAVARRIAHLLDATTDHALELVDTPSALPPASSDYWEVRETSLTLGTAGPLLAGLESAGRFYRDVDWGASSASAGVRAERASRAAGALRAAVEDRFGAGGYPRHITGGPQDAATAFVLPPFQPAPLDGALEAWYGSALTMGRPAGGLAPGAGWREDGISWTPQTALYALAAAANDHPEVARAALRWLEEHRTASGAIPEKVLADGSPAAVAPLTWSSAVVVLTLVELDRASG